MKPYLKTVKKDRKEDSHGSLDLLYHVHVVDCVLDPKSSGRCLQSVMGVVTLGGKGIVRDKVQDPCIPLLLSTQRRENLQYQNTLLRKTLLKFN